MTCWHVTLLKKPHNSPGHRWSCCAAATRPGWRKDCPWLPAMMDSKTIRPTHFLRPYDRDRSVEEAMQSYLDWEIALMDKLDKDGTVAFKTA